MLFQINIFHSSAVETTFIRFSEFKVTLHCVKLNISWRTKQQCGPVWIMQLFSESANLSFILANCLPVTLPSGD
jgi:hypothetical protein